MSPPKFDVIVEAVHYAPDGLVNWVRGYERRGPTFSDLVLIRREELVERLKSGQKFVFGRRLPHLASTFEVNGHIHLISHNGDEVLVTDDSPAGKDNLQGVPVL